MKSTVIEQPKEEIPQEYPCLKATENKVVLFTKPETGILVCRAEIGEIGFLGEEVTKNTGLELGYFSEGWAEDIFINYTGKIQLSND